MRLCRGLRKCQRGFATTVGSTVGSDAETVLNALAAHGQVGLHLRKELKETMLVSVFIAFTHLTVRYRLD